MDIVTVRIDLAKNVFALHGADHHQGHVGYHACQPLT